MAESEEKLFYDKIANNIQGNIVKINEILSNCKINSNFASNESQKKIVEFFENKDLTSSIIKKESSAEYYDSNTLSEIFKLLESGSSTSHGNKQLTISRTVSLSSLGSESDHQDNFSEATKQFEDLKHVLDSIVNCPINIPDMNSITIEETERKNEFIELVLSLQKLAKELRNIAMTDNMKNKVDLSSVAINDEFLNNLKKLSSSLESVLKLDANKNPITAIPKKKDDFENNLLVSSLCERL